MPQAETSLPPVQLETVCRHASRASDSEALAEESYFRLGIFSSLPDAVACFLGAVAKKFAAPRPREIALEFVEIVLSPSGFAEDVKNLDAGFEFVKLVMWRRPG